MKNVLFNLPFNIKNIKFANIVFFIIGIIHYIAIFIYQTPSSYNPKNFIAAKIISFIFIIIFWQFFPVLYYGLKNKDKKIINYTKHTIIYFSICILIMLMTYPIVKQYAFTYDLPRDIILLRAFEYIDFSYITNLLYLVSYNIIPVAKAIPVINLFWFSLIFSYIICSLESYVSEKYAKLIYIPFVIPIFLMYIHIPSKRIYLLWCLLFILFYIFINQNKKEHNYFKSVFIGIISAVCVSFSFEYITAIVFIPLMFFCLKVFSKKSFAVFLVVLFSMFPVIQKQNLIGDFYIMENLIITFQRYYGDHPDKTIDIEAKQILEKTFPDINDIEKPWSINIINSNQQDSKKSIKYLTSFTLKHCLCYIKIHLGSCFEEISLTTVLSKNFPSEINFNINDFPVKKYFIKAFLPFTNNKYLRIIYSIYPALLLLLIILFMSIVKRKSFYIYFVLTQFSFILISLIFVPFYNYMYYFPFIFLTYIFSFAFLIDNKKHSV